MNHQVNTDPCFVHTCIARCHFTVLHPYLQSAAELVAALQLIAAVLLPIPQRSVDTGCMLAVGQQAAAGLM